MKKLFYSHNFFWIFIYCLVIATIFLQTIGLINIPNSIFPTNIDNVKKKKLELIKEGKENGKEIATLIGKWKMDYNFKTGKRIDVEVKFYKNHNDLIGELYYNNNGKSRYSMVEDSLRNPSLKIENNEMNFSRIHLKNYKNISGKILFNLRGKDTLIANITFPDFPDSVITYKFHR